MLKMNDMVFPLFCNGYVAQLCGEKAAIIFHQISYLIYNNRNDGTGFHDGKFWMTKTLDAWANYYPNINRDQAFRALGKLEDAGLIESSKFNTESFNQAKWYSITEKGWRYVSLKIRNENSNTDFAKTQQGSAQPPVAKTQNLARANKVLLELYQNTVIGGERAREESTILNKPIDVQEVIEEAGKRHCVISKQQAQDFIDKFEAVSENGTWISGKNIVTDWRKLITSGWIRCWQREFRESRTGNQDDGRQTLDELASEIARERAARGQA